MLSTAGSALGAPIIAQICTSAVGRVLPRDPPRARSLPCVYFFLLLPVRLCANLVLHIPTLRSLLLDQAVGGSTWRGGKGGNRFPGQAGGSCAAVRGSHMRFFCSNTRHDGTRGLHTAGL